MISPGFHVRSSVPNHQKNEKISNNLLTAAPAISFWLSADQQRAVPESPPFEAESVERPRGNKVVALLAEDNRPDVLLVEEAISLYGLPIELHVVEDGEKAFEFIARAEGHPQAPCPEIVLLDLNLPKRSGKEVLQRLRQSPKCKDIPVLIITSSNSAKDRKEVAQLGANGYFRKPASYDEFLKVGEELKTILEHRS